MRKDNYGICLSFYAVLGFVFAMLGHTTLSLLLLGFVIVVQKDKWLTMQVMEAFFLCFISGIVSTIVSAFSGLYGLPFIGTIISGFFGVITFAVSILIFIMCIVGLIKVAKEQEANIPIAKGFAEKAFGLVKKVTYTQEETAQDTQNNA